MEERELTEKESLTLISQMIQNTQNKIIRNQGTPFLIWGYGVTITSLAVWLLVRLTGNMSWNFLWFAPSAVCYPLMAVFTRRQERQQTITTYVDRVINYIWATFGIAEGVATIAMFISGFALGASFPIFYITMLLLGTAITLTGLVIRFRAIILGGAAALALSFAFLFLHSASDIYLIFALAMIVTMVIPGHILNHKARKQCSER
ncbi:MAG: hypothetical protein SOZ00_01785 [Tidjanibacter sp.]|nr:hypothetical protein [Tidjanibacter sp.]